MIQITHKRTLLFSFIILATSFTAFSQNIPRNPKVKVPDIPGYVTLKCDFHMHTAYSDGHVMPKVRVDEAERDGLDVISVTEHSDMEKYPDEIKRDREHAFQLGVSAAEDTHVLVIRGAEISPRVPPYHNNALFLQNADKLPYGYTASSKKVFIMKENPTKEELMAPFLEVQKQGGFVIYNHPNYSWWDGKSHELFTPFHQELLAKGILGGVEVVNGQHYNVFAHRMAEKYNLTMTSGTDAHADIPPPSATYHRPMTLVFAKDKSEAAVKEALLAKRTAVYTENVIIARKPEAEAFFKASLVATAIKKQKRKSPQLEVRIENKSDIPYDVICRANYELDDVPNGRITLKANSTTTFTLDPVWEYPAKISLRMTVENILVAPEKTLETELEIAVKDSKE
ncbi:MAG: phosphotransferase [Sphingobacteriaceae bacterium]|jgi:hypothetical protein|nr:phosphotransferase [Sphingobacteriaceae bacterium]